MSDLINLRLDIFSYLHRGGLGESQESISLNSQYFWDSFPKDFPVDLKISLKQEDSLDSYEYGELLKLTKENKPYYLFYPESKSDKKIQALYYPVRLHDTYGLAFGCGIDSKNEALPVKSFSDLRALVPNFLLGQSKPTQRFKYNFIGNTWMLSGCLAPDPTRTKEEIAQAIFKQLGFYQEWSNVKSEEFLGATMFEVGQTPQQWNRLENNHHVLIFLFHNSETMDLVSEKFYESWMRLFCYRNKIVWAYWQSLTDISWLNKNFFSLDKVRKNPAIKSLIIDKQKETDNIAQIFNLESLQDALQDNSFILYEYVRKLSILQIHQQTIETNIDNYNERLNIIEDKAYKFNLNYTTIDLLESFSKIVAQKYKKIVEKEYFSLRPGLGILQNLTDTLRGYIQIQQAEIDRSIEQQNRRLEDQNTKLQNRLTIVGVGLGAASVTASASANFVGEIVEVLFHKTNIIETLPLVVAVCNILGTLVISLCVGMFFSTLVSLLLSLIKRIGNSK